MRDPNEVLKQLTNIACRKPGYIFTRLYRNLYGPKLYVAALAQGRARNLPSADMCRPGNLRGCIDRLTESMRTGSWRQERAVKNRDTPLFGSFEDQLVQEAVAMLLRPIWAPSSPAWAFGPGDGHGCHQALAYLKQHFSGCSWFVEGALEGCLERLKPSVLLGLLRRRIADDRFVSLIGKFLQAGIMRQWTHTATYSGTARGSALAMTLAGIALQELDEVLAAEAARAMTDGCRVVCVRYAEHILVGIRGTGAQAAAVCRTLEAAAKDRLQLDHMEARVLPAREPARFAGHEVRAAPGRRAGKCPVRLYVPKKAWVGRLLAAGSLKIRMRDGREVFEPVHRRDLLWREDADIRSYFFRQIRSMRAFYRFADNTSVLGRFAYVMKYSLYKTLAAKHRTKIRRIIPGFRDDEVLAPRSAKGRGHRSATAACPGGADPDLVPYARHHPRSRSGHRPKGRKAAR